MKVGWSRFLFWFSRAIDGNEALLQGLIHYFIYKVIIQMLLWEIYHIHRSRQHLKTSHFQKGVPSCPLLIPEGGGMLSL